MTFLDRELTQEHQLLMSAAERFAKQNCPVNGLRRSSGTVDIAQDYYSQSAGLGWYGFLLPPEAGGGSIAGDGVFDAAIVAEQRGRWLQPGAFVGMNVVADAIRRSAGGPVAKEVMAAIGSAESIAAWVWTTTRPTAIRWTRNGGDYCLNGVAQLVPEGGSAEWLLVTATSEGVIVDFLIPRTTSGLRIVELDTFDPTRRAARVHFENAVIPAEAELRLPSDQNVDPDRHLRIALTLLLPEMVGAMAAEFELALDYAKSRQAFGRPIGAFQAIKHLLADTSLLLEASRAAVSDAIEMAGTKGKGDLAVSVAKAFVSESALQLTQNCLQVFAGIGLTWEHEHHFYMRRLATDALSYGDSSWHRMRLYELHRDSLAADHGTDLASEPRVPTA